MNEVEMIIVIIYYAVLASFSYFINWLYSNKVNWFIKKDVEPEDQSIGVLYPLLSVLFLVFGFLGFLLPVISPDYYDPMLQLEAYIIVGLFIGSIIMLVGLTFIVLSVYQLKSWQLLTGVEEEELKTTGIFKYSRHPQDLGTALFFIGFALFTNNLVTILIPVIIALALYRISITEDERFMFFFPKEWKEYTKETNRWLSSQLLWPK